MKKLTLMLAIAIILSIFTTDVHAEELVPGEELIEETVELPYYAAGISEEEFTLLCKVVYSESNNQPTEGKRLVADTVLNRVVSEEFPDTIEGVIKQKSQYTYHCPVIPEDIKLIVTQELLNRYNTDVIYFKTQSYHSFGTPCIQVGAHYFSK